MDTITTHEPGPLLETVPLGTIRPSGISLRLSREPGEAGQWRYAVDAIETPADVRLGVVVVAPGWPPAPIWEPAAAARGIVFGSRVEISIVETCEDITDAILHGVFLDGRAGFRPAPECPYAIPMREQVGVAWVD
jgi:hypothetical protein